MTKKKKFRKKSRKKKTQKRVSPESFKPELTKLGLSLREAMDHIQIEHAAIADGLASESRDQSQLVRRADILIQSKAARIVAVHRVLSNRGSRSYGLGPPRPTTNGDYVILVEKLRSITRKPDSYRAKPLDRIYIPKGKFDTETIEPTLDDDPNLSEKTLRPISIPTGKDTLVSFPEGQIIE